MVHDLLIPIHPQLGHFASPAMAIKHRETTREDASVGVDVNFYSSKSLAIEIEFTLNSDGVKIATTIVVVCTVGNKKFTHYGHAFDDGYGNVTAYLDPVL